MTNPDNIVRVRARNGGRASVYEANGWAQSYSTGLFEGDGVIQNTVADMNVLVGGSSSKPDVVLAENPAGYKIALDLVGQQPIAITAPASNNRISSIVAYTDDLSLATTEDTVTGSPASCGLIVVNGTAAVNPTEPSDADIRSAITADGATGSQAAYVVIANILVANNTTAITNSLIVTNRATLNVTNNLAPASITADKLDFTTLWPVGSYYETSDLTFDPNVSWGGTWVQDSVGRVTIGYDSSDSDFNSAGKTGGGKSHYHTTGASIGTTDIVAGQGVCAKDTNDTSTTKALPPYVVVVRWHRTA